MEITRFINGRQDAGWGKKARPIYGFKNIYVGATYLFEDLGRLITIHVQDYQERFADVLP